MSLHRGERRFSSSMGAPPSGVVHPVGVSTQRDYHSEGSSTRRTLLRARYEETNKRCAMADEHRRTPYPRRKVPVRLLSHHRAVRSCPGTGALDWYPKSTAVPGSHRAGVLGLAVSRVETSMTAAQEIVPSRSFSTGSGGGLVHLAQAVVSSSAPGSSRVSPVETVNPPKATIPVTTMSGSA